MPPYAQQSEVKWTTVEKFLGPEPKKGQHGQVTCHLQVSDHSTPRYSHQFGFTADGAFKSARYIPHYRADEFLDVLERSMDKVDELTKK